MNNIAGKLIAAVLMAGLLGLPTVLEAKGRRGAALIITRIGGSSAAGELIAVGSDSLVLRRGGADWTVPRAKIASVSVLRRSRKASATLVGFTAGVLTGVSWGISYGDSGAHGIRTPVKAGAWLGLLGAVVGLTAGRSGRVDLTLVFAGSSSLAASENWDALRDYSREARRAKAARRR